MAERQEPQRQVQPQNVQQTPAQQASQAYAESVAAAEANPLDEVDPKVGPRYLVNDQLVDADGKPVKDKD